MNSFIESLNLKTSKLSSIPFLNAEISLTDKMHVIGVVEDFHFSTLEESIEPVMLTGYNNRIRNIMLKISGNDPTNVLQKVEKILQEFDPGYALNYIILEDFFRNRYGSQDQLETLSTYTAIFSLILAMLGLYALTAILVNKRAREIALRKINGATRVQILKFLIKRYTLPVIISFIVAAPVGWYLMYDWLQNFAYRTGLSWWIFILTGIIAFFIALLTVFWQSLRAATTNPADALRNE